ncbi:hypothetical protein IMZ48_28565 [Candidatus Bathyarchaeota archaeon]|nr:hypothetical protein [Candidatus Bathyarchaeota archaeon]
MNHNSTSDDWSFPLLLSTASEIPPSESRTYLSIVLAKYHHRCLDNPSITTLYSTRVMEPTTVAVIGLGKNILHLQTSYSVNVTVSNA